MTRRRRPFRRRLVSPRRIRLLVVLLLLAALAAFRSWQTARRPPAPDVLPEGQYRVARVIDGDTLVLGNGARVRLIGIDCPEMGSGGRPAEPLAERATEFVRRLIASAGGTVRIQLDRERVDRYGRFLAYVWVGQRLLNEELVREGLAEARLNFYYSQSMKRRLQRAQEEAEAARRGIWQRSQEAPGGL